MQLLEMWDIYHPHTQHPPVNHQPSEEEVDPEAAEPLVHEALWVPLNQLRLEEHQEADVGQVDQCGVNKELEEGSGNVRNGNNQNLRKMLSVRNPKTLNLNLPTLTLLSK